MSSSSYADCLMLLRILHWLSFSVSKYAMPAIKPVSGALTTWDCSHVISASFLFWKLIASICLLYSVASLPIPICKSCLQKGVTDQEKNCICRLWLTSGFHNMSPHSPVASGFSTPQSNVHHQDGSGHHRKW